MTRAEGDICHSNRRLAVHKKRMVVPRDTPKGIVNIVRSKGVKKLFHGLRLESSYRLENGTLPIADLILLAPPLLPAANTSLMGKVPYHGEMKGPTPQSLSRRNVDARLQPVRWLRCCNAESRVLADAVQQPAGDGYRNVDHYVRGGRNELNTTRQQLLRIMKRKNESCCR